MNSHGRSLVETTLGARMTRRTALRRLVAAGAVIAPVGTALLSSGVATVAASSDHPDAVTVNEIPFRFTTSVDGRSEIWFRYQPTGNAPKQLIAATYGSNYDTYLFMYRQGELVYENDDSGMPDENGEVNKSVIRFDVTPGAPVFFKVMEYNNYANRFPVPDGAILTFSLFPIGLG